MEKNVFLYTLENERILGKMSYTYVYTHTQLPEWKKIIKLFLYHIILNESWINGEMIHVPECEDIIL